jgi:APA family basic amino acid/polyamine antiporter
MSSAIGARQKLGFGMATALVVGNMIGSGVFLLPSALAPYGGISIVGWLFTAVGAMLLALVFARLARAYPKTGGPYAYSRLAFGDFIGFQTAWGYWINIWVGNAAIAVAFAGYLAVFIRNLTVDVIIALLAFAYALWAIAGAGADVVLKGTLLFLAGIPVYVAIKWRTGIPARAAAPSGVFLPLATSAAVKGTI